MSTVSSAFLPRPWPAAVGPLASLALVATLLCTGCSKPAEVQAPVAGDAPMPATAPAPAARATTFDHADEAGKGIAWRHAANDSEVDAAFASARSEAKPVFVYWGAKWCPPCNQVKATLFNRQDFIERSRAFVPVYVDGDSPGAQKLGARFHVSGYPTMVLFAADGREVTRLPGEVEPKRYSEVLTLGMNAARPVKDVLADALAGGKGLTANDWRLLAFYSWDTDQQLLPKTGLAATLATLADACPAEPSETAMRLRLKALAAVADKAQSTNLNPNPKATAASRTTASRAADRRSVLALLQDAAKSREQTDVLSTSATEIVRALTSGTQADTRLGANAETGTAPAERAELLAAFDAALARLEADTSLSRADRMQALIARVDLARIDVPDDDKPAAAASPVLPPPLLADVREQSARADREITDGYERQAVITAAAYLLERSGLGDESDALLKANLAKSHSPYYLMSELAGNAKKRGDNAEALHWYGEAFAKSEGPATRLQWGSSYVNALIELSPGDEAAIEAAVGQLWSEAAAQPDAFYERSARSLQRVGSKLAAWNRGGAHAATMARLQGRLDTLCAPAAHTPAERSTCRGLLSPAPKKTA